jgi:hypothetical protein
VSSGQIWRAGPGRAGLGERGRKCELEIEADPPFVPSFLPFFLPSFLSFTLAVKNSWGSEWGSEGIFRFIRGQDLCGIESDVWAACPEGAFCELTAGVHRMETRRPTPELLSHPLLDARINELFLNAGRDVAPRRLGQSTSQRVQEIVEVDNSRVPSSTWRGGYWRPLSRDEFSSKPFNLKVAHAYEQAFGEPTSPKLAAEAAISVTTQAGSFGVKVRAVFAKEDGTSVEVVHVHAPNGHITHL